MAGLRRTLDMEALYGITGRSFFYPCAWQDWKEMLDAFGDVIDEFHFVDVNYQFAKSMPIVNPRWRLLPDQTALKGPAVDTLRTIENVRHPYRDITPAWLRERYINLESSRTIQVIRRRGFGEYALDELPDNSLGIFCHRGDSGIHAGSRTSFLANQKRSHQPLSNLFEKIKRKLAYPALIVSDASNTTIRQLFVSSVEMEFDHFGLHWRRIGELNVEEHRPTFVWQVEPVEVERSV